MALARLKSAFRPRRRFHTAFTFIEMIAVTFVIVLAALAAMANISAGQRGERLRSFQSEVVRIALSARESAIASGQTTTLRLGDSERSLALSGGGMENVQSAAAQVLLPSEISMRDFQVDGQPVAASEWEVSFYADGTCTRAGIAFWDGRSEEFAAVYEAKRGRASIVQGQIPDMSVERWEAGEMEVRGGGGFQP